GPFLKRDGRGSDLYDVPGPKRMRTRQRIAVQRYWPGRDHGRDASVPAVEQGMVLHDRRVIGKHDVAVVVGPDNGPILEQDHLSARQRTCRQPEPSVTSKTVDQAHAATDPN